MPKATQIQQNWGLCLFLWPAAFGLISETGFHFSILPENIQSFFFFFFPKGLHGLMLAECLSVISLFLPTFVEYLCVIIFCSRLSKNK